MSDQVLVLVVDDQKIMRDFVQLFAFESGWMCDTVASGQEALDYLEGRKPNLIISDYNMPGMSGIQLLRMIKGNPDLAGIPFVLMTGGGDLGERQALRAGCDGFLQKPFTFEQFQELIIRLLGK